MNGVANHRGCVITLVPVKGIQQNSGCSMPVQKYYPPLHGVQAGVRRNSRAQVWRLGWGLGCKPPLHRPNQCTSYFLQMHFHRGHLLLVLGLTAKCWQIKSPLTHLMLLPDTSKELDVQPITWASGESWSGEKERRISYLKNWAIMDTLFISGVQHNTRSMYTL